MAMTDIEPTCYEGQPLGNGRCVNSLLYVSAVKDGLREADLWISDEWVMQGNYNRIMLHRSMGLLPAQSVEELRPYAEAQLRPRLMSRRAEMRYLREKSDELERQGL